jgi:hypothetical protein
MERHKSIQKSCIYWKLRSKGHGMQIFDLTKLRDNSNTPRTFTSDFNYWFWNAHNIVINEDTGYALC